MKRLALLAFLLLFNYCDLSENSVIAKEKEYKITPLSTTDISVEEPSGLALSNDKKSLYTVSDQTGEIYQLNLNGVLLSTIKLHESLDLEGICCDKTSDNLWVVEEKTRELLKVAPSGEILFRKKILSGEDNSGLEGICFGKNGNIVLVKEKDPGYFIELDENFNIIEQELLDFELDFSGITYDAEIDEYMMLSQEGKKLIFYLPGEDPVYTINLTMDSAEGIAYNSATNTLYIVDDNSGKLYQFRLEEISSK